jgi:hypothetical protein
MKWLMVVQCHLANMAIGMEVSPADFGCPEEYVEDLSQLPAQGNPNQQLGDMHGMIDGNAGRGTRMVFAGQ